MLSGKLLSWLFHRLSDVKLEELADDVGQGAQLVVTEVE